MSVSPVLAPPYLASKRTLIGGNHGPKEPQVECSLQPLLGVTHAGQCNARKSFAKHRTRSIASGTVAKQQLE